MWVVWFVSTISLYHLYRSHITIWKEWKVYHRMINRSCSVATCSEVPDSRRLVYCLCCENICKLKMLFVFGLRSFHNLVAETSWLQGWILWYLYFLWGNYGYFKMQRIDIGHWAHLKDFKVQSFEEIRLCDYLFPKLTFYTWKASLNHETLSTPACEFDKRCSSGENLCPWFISNFIQWLSLIFLLWNKNFLTKFLNSIISLDLKSAVN